MDLMASRPECKACTRVGVLSVVQGGGNNACLSTYTLDHRRRENEGVLDWSSCLLSWQRKRKGGILVSCLFI